MRIATWNINSINARLETALRWFEEAKPDVACLQEIKCVDEKFPTEAFERLGYNVAVHGQKTYNGVAILSKTPLEDVRRGLPGADLLGEGEEDHARYLEAVVSGENPVRVASIYLPNGNPAPGPKFDYKLRWMERLNGHARDLLALEEPLALVGDYNVIPEPRDAAHPENWTGDALFQPQSRGAFQALKWLGLTEAFMSVDGSPEAYTFWDYQAGAWQRNNGIRIDHALLSPQAADRLKACVIHRDVRGWDKPSDHVPVVIELDLEA